MSKGKAAKGKKLPASDRSQYRMKLVLSDSCAVCPTPCARGTRYLEYMKLPGSLGKGVPCVLTRTKA
ncbi:hypothetical protein [Paenibacillus daejeonensis]|uniref:hypothetical protein n=1 Tax=Paenibacillus daejeonensis TaxID=135193 RepID=UPI001FE1DB84|nr:hypothetical protein [Paenibacillus daejeonensis]